MSLIMICFLRFSFLQNAANCGQSAPCSKTRRERVDNNVSFMEHLKICSSPADLTPLLLQSLKSPPLHWLHKSWPLLKLEYQNPLLLLPQRPPLINHHVDQENHVAPDAGENVLTDGEKSGPYPRNVPSRFTVWARPRPCRHYLPSDTGVKLMYADYVEKGNNCSYESYRKAVKSKNMSSLSSERRSVRDVCCRNSTWRLTTGGRLQRTARSVRVAMAVSIMVWNRRWRPDQEFKDFRSSEIKTPGSGQMATL